MIFKKLIAWLWAPDDRPDPVLPRLWQGPATPVPKGYSIPAEELAKLGIDPTRVAKFQSFHDAEVWLNTDVVAAYEEPRRIHRRL